MTREGRVPDDVAIPVGKRDAGYTRLGFSTTATSLPDHVVSSETAAATARDQPGRRDRCTPDGHNQLYAAGTSS